MAEKTPVKKAVKKPKTPAAHPKYSDMVATAVGSLKESGGSSRQAILKYIMANFKVRTDAHLKIALRNGVKKGALKQSKGTGAAGSFKLGEKPKPAKKPGAKKVTKPKAAKPKKPAAKKATTSATAKKPKAKTPKKAATKKTTEKKPAKKTTKPKTPKKKATKSPKKAKTDKPKKAKAAKK
ncbi:histone H1-delta-like [Ylistrum balloti]|uniref:histone H1-delta-like n=1 Tax=Ylistrum balloti TaxID=509963 RepID=UPI0029058225|nr:histone H1-delta-like [Ylistrum balloti]